LNQETSAEEAFSGDFERPALGKMKIVHALYSLFPLQGKKKGLHRNAAR
jgi:hypothetical protein